MQSEAAAAESNRDAAQTELQAADQRLKESHDEYNQTLKKKEETAYELSSYELGLRNISPPLRPAPQAAGAPAAQADPVAGKHVVASGDSLRSIANFYYGDPNRWEPIYNATGT